MLCCCTCRHFLRPSAVCPLSASLSSIGGLRCVPASSHSVALKRAEGGRRQEARRPCQPRSALTPKVPTGGITVVSRVMEFPLLSIRASQRKANTSYSWKCNREDVLYFFFRSGAAHKHALLTQEAKEVGAPAPLGEGRIQLEKMREKKNLNDGRISVQLDK